MYKKSQFCQGEEFASPFLLILIRSSKGTRGNKRRILPSDSPIVDWGELDGENGTLRSQTSLCRMMRETRGAFRDLKG